MAGIICACIYVDYWKPSCDRYNITGIAVTGIMCVLAFMKVLEKLLVTGIRWQV